jgi:hypothetical protein
VVVIDVNMLRRSWYVQYLSRAYPELVAHTQAEVEAFLDDLKAWEQDPRAFAASWALTQRIDAQYRTMIMAFVRTHLRTAPVYATHDVALGFNGPDAALTRAINDVYQLVPNGLVFELFAERGFRPLAPLSLATRGLFDGTVALEPDDVVTLKVRPVYLTMVLNRGRYLALHGEHEQAVGAFRQVLVWDPSFAAAKQDLARSASRVTGDSSAPIAPKPSADQYRR